MKSIRLTRSTTPPPKKGSASASVRPQAELKAKPEPEPNLPKNAVRRAPVAEPAFRERVGAVLKGTHFPKVVGGVDGVLFGTVIALIVFGVVMVYSASSVRAVRLFGDGHYYLIRQAIYAAIALPLLVAIARIDYHRYRPLAKPLLAVAVVLLLLVIMGLGRKAGGASRWIQVGPINIQPAEVTKVAMILWLADSLAKKAGRIRSFSVGFLPHVLMAGFLVALCMAQPDFGSSVILMLLTFVMMFTAGAKMGYMLAGAVVLSPIAYLLVRSSEYRWQRIIAFTDPFKYRMTGGYQIVESWTSFSGGGLWGVGLGDSRQKMLFLPEAHTDFIAAIVAEELGYVGFCCMMAAFVLVVVRGVRTALKAVDDYGTYLAIGITMFIGIQVVTNLAVVLGLLPTKGLTLPFLSSGGSSLLVNCAAVGILLNVSRPRLAPTTRESFAPSSEPSRSVRENTRRERVAAMPSDGVLTGGAR